MNLSKLIITDHVFESIYKRCPVLREKLEGLSLREKRKFMKKKVLATRDLEENSKAYLELESRINIKGNEKLFLRRDNNHIYIITQKTKANGKQSLRLSSAYRGDSFEKKSKITIRECLEEDHPLAMLQKNYV